MDNTNPIERELKWTVTGALPDLSQVTVLGGYPLKSHGIEHQNNSYYDTVGRALSQARVALRIRRLEAAAILTYKGQATVNDGIHSRLELETTLADPKAQLSDFNDPAIGAAVKAITPEPLLLLVQTKTVRQKFQLTGIGELVLDTVQVYGDETDRVVLEFCEIELELLPSVTATMIASIEADLKTRVEMTASISNKLERALRAVMKAIETADTPTTT
jgi:inorganic triphosphatase YgiF